ncbi:MAG TPA: hypothetical protein VGI27_08170 [Solirubrobacteraceae bacterium]
MRRLVEAFRKAQRPIVHIVRIYEQDASNAEPCRRRLLADGARLMIRDTPGCQLARQLLSEPALRLDNALLLAGGVQMLGACEVAIFKPRWGAFYRTPLEEHLRSQGVSGRASGRLDLTCVSAEQLAVCLGVSDELTRKTADRRRCADQTRGCHASPRAGLDG